LIPRDGNDEDELRLVKRGDTRQSMLIHFPCVQHICPFYTIQNIFFILIQSKHMSISQKNV